MKSRVTARMVAERAGVSVGTVDRAFNKRGRIHEETRARIFEAAEALQYKPNKLASALGKQRDVRIAVVFPREPDYFFGKMLRGIRDAERAFGDFGVTAVHLPVESLRPEAEERVLKDIRPGTYAGVLINAGGPGLNRYIESLSAAGVPVATFNSDVPSGKRLFFVGHDDERSGAMAAGLLGELAAGRGRAAVLTGFESVGAHSARVRSFRNTLEREYPAMEVVPPVEYEDDEEKAYAGMRSLLERMPDLAGVFAASAPGAVGAGRALAELPAERRPRLVGYDVNEHIRDLMERRICSAVIYQDPYAQSYLALSALARHILEGWMPKSDRMYVAPRIVLRQNVDQYLDDAPGAGEPAGAILA